MKNYNQILEIPEGVEVSIEGDAVNVKGQKGEFTKKYVCARVNISKEGNKIILSSKKGIKVSKTDKMLIGSLVSHILNMFNGVKQLYIARLKICTGHFPVQLRIESGCLEIKNFLGEKVPRRATILKGVKVELKGDIIEVLGVDKEAVGQTAANIEQSTRITNRDRRIFQDGCYIVLKPGGKE